MASSSDKNKNLNQLNPMTTTPMAVNGKFIGLNDFYNFIKQNNGENSPTNFYYFSVWFYPENGTSYFKPQNLERLRYSIQKIDLPKSVLKGYENNQAIDGTSSIENIYGVYTFLRNSYFNTDNKTITIRFLNLQKPVIEEVIYPWFYNCVKNEWDSSDENVSSFPKLSMVVRFWSGNSVSQAKGSITSHIFEYFVSGLFPVGIEPYSPAQASSSDDNRSVTFAFNEFRAYLKGENSKWESMKIHTYEKPKEKKPETSSSNKKTGADNLKVTQDLASKLAQQRQNQEANRWLQNIIANAAGASAGNVVSKIYSNNIIKADDIKNRSNTENKSNTTKIQSTSLNKSDLNNLINQNSSVQKSESSLKDAQEKSEIINNTKEKLENNLSGAIDDKFTDNTKSGNMGSLTIDHVINMLNSQKNASSNDSDMSLTENEFLVESMNVDNEFGLILDDTDENKIAYSSTTNYTVSNDSLLVDNKTEFETSDQIKTNQNTYLSTNELEINENVTTNNDSQQTINDIDVNANVPSPTLPSSSINKNNLNDYLKENKKSEYKESLKLTDEMISINSTKNNENNENKNETQVFEIKDLIKSYNDNYSLKTVNDLNEVTPDMLNKISNNLTINEVSGSFKNIQSLISSYKNLKSSISINENQSNLEKSASSIKSNLTLHESREIVENITIDDVFGEIIETDDELESAKNSDINEKKEEKNLETEKTLDEIKNTINQNEVNLNNFINDSDLTLNKIKENYDLFIGENQKSKNNVIETKKDDLVNFSTETTNEKKLEAVSPLTIDDVVKNNKNDIVKNKDKDDSKINVNENVKLKLTEYSSIKNVSKSKEDEIELGKSKLPEYIKVKDDYYERLILATLPVKENIDDVLNTFVKMNKDFNIKFKNKEEFETVSNMYETLKNNKNISVSSYKYLNIYSTNENLDITDVVKEYKSKTNDDLQSFINDVIISNLKLVKDTSTNSYLNQTNLLSTEQIGQTIKNNINTYELKNVKTLVENNKNAKELKQYNVEKMISNDDINDLFN